MFLLDALAGDKPEEAALQTKLLEINLVTNPQVCACVRSWEDFAVQCCSSFKEQNCSLNGLLQVGEGVCAACGRSMWPVLDALRQLCGCSVLPVCLRPDAPAHSLVLLPSDPHVAMHCPLLLSLFPLPPTTGRGRHPGKQHAHALRPAAHRAAV